MKPVERVPAKQFLQEYPTFFSKEKQLNKYHAKKTTIDKTLFDSQSEGGLYSELKLQEKAGLISSFNCQEKESLFAYGEHICDYYVDFLVYHNDGTREYIEHKSSGTSTDAWRIKWKMLVAKYKDDKTVKCSINWYQSKNQFKKKFQYQPKF